MKSIFTPAEETELNLTLSEMTQTTTFSSVSSPRPFIERGSVTLHSPPWALAVPHSLLCQRVLDEQRMRTCVLSLEKHQYPGK